MTKPLRRPLHASPHADPWLLRALETPSRLVAYIALPADRAASVELSAAAMRRFVDAIVPRLEGVEHRITLGGFDPAPPRSGSLTADALFAGTSLRDELSACRAFSAQHDGAPRHGFTFLAKTPPGAREEDPALPHVAFWLDAASLAPAAVEPARQALASILDDAIAGGAESGLLALWDWAPSYGVEVTPYEQACGVDGSLATQRSHCERYVHGVATTGVWLGRRLRERLGDARELRSVASVRPAGEGLAASAADLDALERALAPVLPGARG